MEATQNGQTIEAAQNHVEEACKSGHDHARIHHLCTVEGIALVWELRVKNETAMKKPVMKVCLFSVSGLCMSSSVLEIVCVCLNLATCCLL